MSEIERALESAIKRIDALEEALRRLEQERQREQSGFWQMALMRLANQDMIRGLFHTEILRSAGLITSAPIGEIEGKARSEFVDDPGYNLNSRLADLNLQAVMSEIRGEYKSADDFDPKFKDQN